MGIIFIDFSYNMDSKNKNIDSYYSLSLRDQYENIKKRLPRNVQIIDELEVFIEQAFPTGMIKKYYITTPNFEREKREVGYASFLNNVVIKPELTENMKMYLPENTNVILFGDIQETDHHNKFLVKGIELIDSSISGKSDIIVDNSYCVHSFSLTKRNGRNVNKWTNPRADYSLSIFTPNFVKKLIEESFPLSKSNLSDFLKFYDKWNEFITFRLDYLQEQSNRYFKVDSINLLEGYSINRRTYTQNETNYEKLLLIDHKEFKKGEQILLNSEVPDSEPFNLLEVNIDFNKKEFDNNKVENHRGRKVNPVEAKLKSFTRENLSLTTIKPTSKTYDSVLRESQTLDDRYKIISLDVQPDVSGVILKYEKINDEEQKNIKLKYKKLVQDKLEYAVSEKEIELKIEHQEIITEFVSAFNNNLEEMVELNEDLEINKTINKLIKEKEKELTKKIKAQKKKKKDKNVLINLEKELEEFINEIDVKSFYIAKHEKQKEELLKKLNKELNKKINEFKKEELKRLKSVYDREQNEEINKNIILNEQLRNDEINLKIENETIKRFSIYFKIEQEHINKKTLNDIKKNEYLIYNNRAEKAKLDRQKQSLENFYRGNVKNPYLATYLFGPDELDNEGFNSDFSNWNWHLEYLNDKQKEAVYKAVTSNGIFLLQGPPGTGKTQVIAEIVSQFVQRDKKVVIASETHKAIDNVFERLPYLADIRPLRLLPDRSTKDTEYKPENLVDNFYNNISKKMKKVVMDYERFADFKENFKDELLKLKMLNDKILREKEESLKVEKQINELSTKNEHVKENIRINKDKINDQIFKIEVLRRTYRNLENSKLKLSDDIEEKILNDYLTEVSNYLSSYKNLIQTDISNLIKEIFNLNSEVINKELKIITMQESEFLIKQKEIEIKRKLTELQDDYGNWKENIDHLKVPLQKELKQILDNKSRKTDFSNLKLTKIMKINEIKNSTKISQQLLSHKEELINIRNKYFMILNEEIANLEKKKNSLERELDKKIKGREEISKEIDTLYYNDNYQSILNDETRLRYNISKIIEDFNLSIKYNTYAEAIIEIEKAYYDLEENFAKKEEENKQIIPIFNKISKYLENEEVIIADRKKYTKILFDKVNVFGITTTSRDKFTQSSISNLEEYNLEDIDLKEQGIDVVIIDEVSKSNFLDLLTPILFGKTVILVGDHRQLPPMYDLRNLREQDFENISEEILTQDKNEEYTKLYETSFFKTLFEKIPNDYKVMLDKQYRSHEHIMQVYNCFYNNHLKLGKEGQNAEKQHHLSVISNNRQIITPDKHVYFVDCKEFENRDSNSTSIYNINEANVVIKLLSIINDNYIKNENYNPKKDEKMSIGIITTYGDQARVIKRRLKNARLKLDAFNKNADSKLIISTVDDFQGDERDIIILSMVRNPENRARSNPGFKTSFERVNVAISRERRLLIIV